MTQLLTPDLCVIGGGAGGLAAAAAAAQRGAAVVLVERDRMGGDGLHRSCTPGKALIAAARRAQAVREARRFGVHAGEPRIDFPAVLAHVRSVVAAIEPDASAERYDGLGVDVIQASARFTGRQTVAAGDYEIRARRFIVATGSSPAIPPIPGLERTPYLTTETVLTAEAAPMGRTPFAHLIIVGAGPSGVEFAQAFRRLGADVTVIEAAEPLPRDEEELKAVVLRRLRAEGVRFLDQARVERVEPLAGASGVHVTFVREGRSYAVDGSHLLLATGRRPNMEGLCLDTAEVRCGQKGILVDDGFRTSNRSVYAVGDVVGQEGFAHMAAHHANLVVRNALFRLPVKIRRETIPWVTFTDPELAHVGLTEEEARSRHKRIGVLRHPYHDNARAQAEGRTEGFLKVVTTKDGRILGAGMVGDQAGELIQMWSLAMQKDMNIKAMASYVAPGPTLAEINVRAALNHFLPGAAEPRLRRLIGWLAKLG